MARYAGGFAVGLAAVAVALLAAGCGSGLREAARSTSTPARPASRVTRASVARAFALAYLAYIDGRGEVGSLPHSTAAVRAAARTGGTVPVDRRDGRLVLVALKPAAGVRHGVLVTARNRVGTLYAQETLARSARGWRVTGLLTPDFVQAFVKQRTQAAPTPIGSAVAKRAARRFLAGYLPYYYGHAPASDVHGDTAALERHLAAHSPNVPPAMQSLQGRVAGIAMVRAGAGWRALVDVRDARSTCQLTLTLARVASRWAVMAVSAQ